jgi:hypothetical protein
VKENNVVIDPITKQTVAFNHFINRQQQLDTRVDQKTAPPIVIETDHPYRHNAREYFTVAVPHALFYTVKFDGRSSTEPQHDFVRFFRDETLTLFWGLPKYCGGYNGSSSNFCGVIPRSPLIIPAAKFIVHFHSNERITDWGFRLIITPTVSTVNDSSSEHSVRSGRSSGRRSTSPSLSPRADNKPRISKRAQSFRNEDPVHERLYKTGMQRLVEVHNMQVVIRIRSACISHS